ncbi:SusC/RagA family TonB-linked outer membrane protein [Alistipes sp. ZOR0009]|uniref:SusC/RagA family TonB-linked outer membrane protein n=1 Tax=Alistipes sp. ZOR0009 TaxID=1339253 RepID=UPI0006456FA4|nr:SusC/RagA family TonB-linked outer membrane protein [Alistipes sp. ZOR0009]
MKRIKLLLLSAFVCLGLSNALAQTKVAGLVTSSEDGQPIPGVTIIVKGISGVGTTTNIDGKYSISVPASGKTLVFSYIGFVTQEIALQGKTAVNVVLIPDSKKLDEVVVTAMGIKMSKDKTGTSVTSVKSDKLDRTGETGVIQSLSGKSSGLQIVRSSGEPGAGAYMQIRGQNTITGNIQPLVIVDGVPVTSGEQGGGAIDGVTQQSRLNDINANDIESVEVLKGASAAAVWGTRAANGVIIITTKSGKSQKSKPVVDFYASLTLDKINVEWDKQDKFGQGKDGKWNPSKGESWGDKIAARAGGEDIVNKTGEYFLTPDGTKIYPIVTKQSKNTYNNVNRDQVFQNGIAKEFGASVSMGDETGSAFISIANLNQEGVIKSSDYDRTNVRFNLKKNLSSTIKAKLNTYYTKVKSNRIQKGSNPDGLYLGYLRTSPDFDNTYYKGTYVNSNGLLFLNSQRSYRNYLGSAAPAYNNPGWTINEQLNNSTVDRFLINPELNIDIFKNLTLTARYGLDISLDKRETFFPKNSASERQSGYYSEDHLFTKEQTAEVFLRGFRQFSKDFALTTILGGQLNDRYYNTITGEYSNYINYLDPRKFIYDQATSDSKNPYNYLSHKKMLGGYLVINADIFDQVFAEFTTRIERSNSYDGTLFYPSGSLAWQFTKFTGTNKVLSFGKLRVSYGTVGIEPPLYITSDDYLAGYVESGWGEKLNSTYFGGHFRRSGVRGNPNIKPEKKQEVEFGTDLRFLNDRISLSGSLYFNKTTDVIFSIDKPASSGYSSVISNAGEITNKGIELDINGDLLKTNDLTLNIMANWSTNKNKVKLAGGVQSVFLDGFTGTSSRAVDGEPLGTLWGGKWARNDNGSLKLDSKGFPYAAEKEGILGDPNPDWRGGIGARLNYKGLTFSFLFERSQGGDMWAGTYGVLNHFGINPETANEVTLSKDVVNAIGNVVPKGSTVRGNLVNFGAGEVLLDQNWYQTNGGGFGPVAEQFVVDATWTRLREVSLSYALPSKLLSKIKVRSVELGVVGRNLFLWTDFKGVDPETNLTGTTNGRGLDYFNNPGTKAFVFSVKLGF